MSHPKPREIPYQGFLPSRPGRIAYLVTDGLCVFTGLTLEATSTVNAAENVLEAIREAEKWTRANLESLIFADLHTHLGYASYPPGSWRYEVLTLRFAPDGDLEVAAWTTKEPPSWALATFAPYLGSEGPLPPSPP